MTEPSSPTPAPSRQERRKAETRRRIIAAADTLFKEQGYEATSIEDISRSADVAVRTIYLHFGSKASIMLSYADAWIEAFIEAVIQRPVDEPLNVMVRRAVDDMAADGWADRAEGGDQIPHPVVDYIGSGPLEIAGHVTHQWMDAVRRLTEHFASHPHEGGEPIDPHARAFAIYALWISSIFAAGERKLGREVPVDSSGVTGFAVLERITSGQL